MSAGHTVEIAEILVVQERSVRAIVPCCFLRICNEPALGIVAFDLVHPILVAPVAIFVLAIEVIVLAWMGNHRDFARAYGTFLVEGTICHVGDI